MKQIFTVLFFSALGCLAYGQERYLDEVFDSVIVTKDQFYAANITIITGAPEVDTLLYDLYVPAGDTMSQRPLAVVLHTGSFLPRGLGSATGDKDDFANAQICTRLAKMGYVTASVQYRLGWDPFNASDVVRRATIIQAAYRGVQDLHTFIRYMNMVSETQGNPFAINPDAVAVVGIGTGGFVGANAAVLNEVEEIFIDKFANPVTGDHFIDTLLFGGLTGEDVAAINIPNHVGYGNDFHFVFSMDGALGDSTWIENGPAPPMVGIGVTSHPTTPFGIDPISGQINCELPVFVASVGNFVVNISGTACYMKKANELGINGVLNNDVILFNDPVTEAVADNPLAQPNLWAINLPGPQAGPWEFWDSTFWKQVPSSIPGFDNIHEASAATNPDMSLEKATNHIDTALWFFAPRACVAMGLSDCGGLVGTKDLLNPTDLSFSIAPNPARDEVRLAVKEEYQFQSVSIFDLQGRLIRYDRELSDSEHHFNVSNISPGMYIIRANFEEGFISQKLVIEPR